MLFRSEEYEHAVRRGAHIYAELSGYALNNEAWHMTTPLPGGDSVIACMRNALASAGLAPEQIDYVNAHASGTQMNDANEAQCLEKVFPRGVPPVSGTKAFTAHPLGATGAIETALCALALEHGHVPPTLHYRTPDPACDIDIVPNVGRDAPLRYVMNNAFGFGGINAVVILESARS